MDDNVERVSDLMTYHKELEQEELFLTALLSKIDKQIHALQVEQLHLLNARNESSLNPTNYGNIVITGDIDEPRESPKEKESASENGNELDLRPIEKCDVMEEYEEEEDSDDAEGAEFPENSADFDYL